ncbi:MAG: CRISPR-associated protein Csx15 [Chloroflexota bacterium]
MIVLNFTHPITDAQLIQITDLLGRTPDQVIDVKTHFDDQLPFVAQLESLMEGIGLTPTQWQSEPILVVPPALNFIAAALLAELHGRMGYFPPIVRTRPVANSIPRRFEVAEILDLQSIRESSRKQR